MAFLATVLARPLLLVGAIGVAAWLLTREMEFATAVDDAAETLNVTVAPTRTVLTAGESTPVTVTAELEQSIPVDLTLTVEGPAGTNNPPTTEREITLAAGDEAVTTTFHLECPVAGLHAFGPLQITVEDTDCRFCSTFERDIFATVQVEARTPDRVHVGEGGESIAMFGEHRAGRQGPGLEPASLREYVPGDPAEAIDWKATARLNEPHVREHEVETDRRSVLVVDHRASMATGRPGERKLDYTRQVALAYLENARRGEEPIGLVSVGEEGLTERIEPATGPNHYENIARSLRTLEPTGTTNEHSHSTASPVRARAAASALVDADDDFSRRLHPFYADASVYVRRVSSDPLFEAVKSTVDRRGPVVTVVLTDDEKPNELLEVIRAGTKGDGVVLALIAPTVLFDPGGLQDLENAHGRYIDFEEFRRSLATRPRTDAFEVAPADRVESVLAVRRERQS